MTLENWIITVVSFLAGLGIGWFSNNGLKAYREAEKNLQHLERTAEELAREVNTRLRPQDQMRLKKERK